jgi:hypothetical protein
MLRCCAAGGALPPTAVGSCGGSSAGAELMSASASASAGGVGAALAEKRWPCRKK